MRLKLLPFADRVHRLPEALVFVGHQLPILRKPHQGGAFPDGRVIVEVFGDLGRQDEIAAIDDAAIVGGLFGKLVDLTGADIEAAEARGGRDGGDGGHLAMGLVEGDEARDIDIADAVAIGHAERLFILQLRHHPAQTAPGHAVLPGVDQGHAPRLCLVVDDLGRALAQIEGHVGAMEVVVGEVFLDDIALVAAADDKVVDAMGRIDLHDVPQDRAAADFHHRLRDADRFLGQPGSKTAGQNDALHQIHSFQTPGHLARKFARPPSDRRPGQRMFAPVPNGLHPWQRGSTRAALSLQLCHSGRLTYHALSSV